MVEIIEAFPFVKVLKYLYLMEKKFEKASDGLVVKEKVNDEEYNVVIKYIKPWIRIILKLGNINDFPEEKRHEILSKLLNLTFRYAEASFGLDDEGNIVAVEDIYEKALTFDVFEEEYGAVPFAVELYKEEILKPLEGKEKPDSS